MELKFSPSVAQIQKVSYAKEAEEKFCWTAVTDAVLTAVRKRWHRL